MQDVCAGLADDDWSRPTGCPGWAVRDVLAHLAAIESELAGGETTTRGEARVVSDRHTQAGVDARRDAHPAQLIDELTRACATRTEQLQELPDDMTAMPPHTPGGVAWDWQTLLRNRAIDLWVHEQDLRRAVGRPGGLDEPGAQVAMDTFVGALGYVLGKRVGPPAGTTVAWEVTGAVPFTRVLTVGPDGRAEQVTTGREGAPSRPETARLRMDTETFLLLATGRRALAPVHVEATGDLRLCGQVVAQMAVTP